jgi:hypothetical protein
MMQGGAPNAESTCKIGPSFPKLRNRQSFHPHLRPVPPTCFLMSSPSPITVHNGIGFTLSYAREIRGQLGKQGYNLGLAIPG